MALTPSSQLSSLPLHPFSFPWSSLPAPPLPKMLRYFAKAVSCCSSASWCGVRHQAQRAAPLYVLCVGLDLVLSVGLIMPGLKEAGKRSTDAVTFLAFSMGLDSHLSPIGALGAAAPRAPGNLVLHECSSMTSSAPSLVLSFQAHGPR